MYNGNSNPAGNALIDNAAFSHTNAGLGQWWKAEFGEEEKIKKIVIRNRSDCCGDRLSLSDVFIGTTKCGQIENNAVTGKTYTVNCLPPAIGSFVEIKTTLAQWLINIEYVEVTAIRNPETLIPINTEEFNLVDTA